MQLAREVLVLSYEGMTKAPHAALERALRFIGLEDPDQEVIERAVDFTTFGNMRNLEEQGFFTSKHLHLRNSHDKKALIARTGKVAGYIEILTAEDLDFIDHEVKRVGHPFAETIEQAV